MLRPLLLASLTAAVLFGQADEIPVFRSDVSLVRVDVQVLDRTSRPITSLQKEDFVLHENGKPVPILNFASEKMPIDILFLLDVSGSMRPHVERIARAAQSALDALSQDDRIGIMVFDRQTRTRLPFTPIGDRVYREFDNVLDRERFNGGTDITRGMLDAAEYMRRNARKEARRGIIILTDDQTEFDRDDERVGQALIDADSVMSALLAPDAIGNRGGFPGGGGGGYPPTGRRRTGGGWGGLGTIILGGGGYPGGGYPGGGGGRYPGGGVSVGRTRSAGTAEISEASGGDSMSVDSAAALETTVARLRQRYALYFNLPPGARQGQQRRIHVALAGNGAIRYPNAELRYRQNYLSPASNDSDPNVTVISEAKPEAPAVTPEERPTIFRRRPVGDGTGGGRGPNPQVGTSEETPAATTTPAPASTGGWRRAEAKDAPAPAEGAPPAETPAPAPAPKKGGWRKVTDPEPATPPAPPKQP